LIVFGIAGIALSSVAILSMALDASNHGPYTARAAVTRPTALTNPAYPIRLEIPAIGADSILEYVGLTPQGAVAVPVGPKYAAWFSLGPLPGQNGSAVIVGHDGWEKGIPAVFDNLYKLKKGDMVYVEDDTGATTAFMVSAVQIYDEHADDSAVFSSSDGKAHLNLITCEGVWNPATQSYSGRIVVFTTEAPAP
jgi:LPXTG-site transpeptidase (sortase) family protein